jgi:Tol biopolymer transport system component
MRRLTTFLCGVLVIVAVAAASAAPASARPRGTNGKILINRADNSATGEEQTFTVDPDGTDFSLLANNSEAGQWSPEGSRIPLFTASGLGILNFDTGVFTSLNLDTLYPDRFLGCGVWSPDGERLACEGFGNTDPSLNGVYTVRSSDGGDLQRVTSNPGGDDCMSDYSPNGKRLVFTRASETVYALFTVKLDGSGMRQITPPEMNFNFCNGSWSPQGNEILFSAHVPSDEHSTIWVVHANGSGLRQIPVPGCGGPDSSPNWVGCFNPSWSPDGKKIVFGRQPATTLQRDIYTVNADGSGLFRVTNTPDIEEFTADWGPHPLTP